MDYPYPLRTRLHKSIARGELNLPWIQYLRESKSSDSSKIGRGSLDLNQQLSMVRH